MKSKRNLIIAIAVLVVVIVVAAIAYNVLAPTVETQTLQPQGEMTASDGASRNGQGTGSNAGNAASNSSGSDDEETDAPNFTMTSVDGQEVTLESLEGKPLVLNFWASTCGPCKSEMPEFQSAYEEYGDQIQFVMVNIPDFNGETRERALQLVEQQGYTFPVYFDDNTEAQMAYGVTSIPQTYFINPDGTVEAYASGAIDGSVLERGLQMIL